MSVFLHWRGKYKKYAENLGKCIICRQIQLYTDAGINFAKICINFLEFFCIFRKYVGNIQTAAKICTFFIVYVECMWGTNSPRISYFPARFLQEGSYLILTHPPQGMVIDL